MVMQIARHRFISNILTLRFTISFVLCLILFAVSTEILVQDYTERLHEYNEQVKAIEDDLKQVQVFARFSVPVLRPPTPLSVICEGAERRLGVGFEVGYESPPTIAEETATKNPLLAVFPSFDVVAIIEIVLSLLAVFLVYDVISGQREDGTLKQVLSNSVPRHTILMGNVLGSMTTIIVPLAIGFLISLIVIELHPSVAFSVRDYEGVAILFFLAVIFLSVFFSIGLFLSCRIRRSATVLIIMLTLWVTTVIVLPNIAVYVARQIVEIPDKTTIDRQSQSLLDQWAADMGRYAEAHPNPQRQIMQSLSGEFSTDDIQVLRRTERNRSVYTGSWPLANSYIFGPREMVQWYLDGSIYGHNLKMTYEDQIEKLYHDYQLKLEKQASIARTLSMMSPSWLFKHTVSDFAGTGEGEYIRFLEGVSRYRGVLINYMKDRGGLDTYLLFTRKPVDAFPTARELVLLSKSGGDEAIKAVADYSFDPLDLSDMPRYKQADADIAASLKAILPNIGIMIVLSLILFVSAWVSFLRADVR